MTDYAAGIARLEDAISRGVLTVESDGERVTYKSTGDLIGALNYLKSEQAAALAGAASARPATTVAVYCPD